MNKSFSYFRVGYGFVSSFFPKYKQGDTVYVKQGNRRFRGKIIGWQLDRNDNFLHWQVCVPSFDKYVPKIDPRCPWDDAWKRARPHTDNS